MCLTYAWHRERVAGRPAARRGPNERPGPFVQERSPTTPRRGDDKPCLTRRFGHEALAYQVVTTVASGRGRGTHFWRNISSTELGWCPWSALHALSATDKPPCTQCGEQLCCCGPVAAGRGHAVSRCPKRARALHTVERAPVRLNSGIKSLVMGGLWRYQRRADWICCEEWLCGAKRALRRTDGAGRFRGLRVESVLLCHAPKSFSCRAKVFLPRPRGCSEQGPAQGQCLFQYLQEPTVPHAHPGGGTSVHHDLTLTGGNCPAIYRL